MKKTKCGKQSPITDFVIEGEGEFNPSKVPPSVTRAITALANLPDGTLLKRRGLANRISISEGFAQQVGGHPVLEKYRMLHGRSYLFGNPTTITAARQRYAK